MTSAAAYLQQTFRTVTLTAVVRPEEFVGKYDVLEVWRSADGAQFTELTGPAWAPARIPESAGPSPLSPVSGPSIAISGEALEIELYGALAAHLSFSFSGVDPRTTASVASQLTAQGAPFIRAYVDATGQLVLESLVVGQGVMLNLLSSDAASILALPASFPDTLSRGKNARLALVEDKTQYVFVDTFGTDSTVYKTRLRHTQTGAVSAFSEAFSAKSYLGVSVNELVVGYLDLVDAEGHVLIGREVSLYAETMAVASGKLVGGDTIVRRTDDTGHVEFSLIRGQVYSLAVSGMNLAKRITAPTDTAVSSFSLIDPTYAPEEDYFRARVPDLPALERRSF